jgi:hypothetical protein
MMLFQMNIEENSVHWTIIYLIITVSAMLIEDFRKVSETSVQSYSSTMNIASR